MSMFITDFRSRNKNPKAHEIAFECDMSLECQDDMSVLMRTEKIWIHQYPNFNFKVIIHSSMSGQSEKGLEYPLYSYIEKKVDSKLGDKDGKSVRLITISKKKYLYSDPDVKERTIRNFL